MDIPRALFPFELVTIIQQILNSHFVAIDLELSGIPVRQRTAKGSKGSRPTLQDHYTEVKEAAQKYQILQFGLTIVEETENDAYTVRPYNFYITPVPDGRLRFERNWTFSSGAVDFLLTHGFNFDKPYSEGVPYISRREEKTIRAEWSASERSRQNLPDMEVSPRDEPFVNAVKETVAHWRGEPDSSRASYLNLPPPADSRYPFPSNKPLNAWQRRMIYQTLRNFFPGLGAQSKNNGEWMQVQERDDTREEQRRSEADRYREKDLNNAIEFRWLIEALIGGDISGIPLDLYRPSLTSKQRSQISTEELGNIARGLQRKVKEHRSVLVGHNMFLDLVNLYQCFIGDLPDSVEDFQILVNSHFPMVIDTKWLAVFRTGSFDSTMLGDVATDLEGQEFPKVRVAEGFNKYKSADAYHEAGYDSYLTATVAIKLSAKRKLQDADKGAGNSLALFGITQGIEISDVSEEIFHTPPESLCSDVEQAKSTSRAQDHINLSNPLKTIKHAIAKVTPSLKGSEQSNIWASEEVSNVSDEKIDQVRDAFAHTTISKLKAGKGKSSSLKDGKNHQGRKGKENTNMFAHLVDLESSDDEDRDEVRVQQMIMEGKLMPRWEDDRFWRVFGNRSRVNACAEGVFDLQPR